MSEQDQKYIDRLGAAQPEEVPDEEAAAIAIGIMRDIAREEVASLCGLVLRRLGASSAGRGMGTSDLAAVESAFGEALRDFSSDTNEPGDAA